MALITGVLVVQFGWRSAFILPGVVALLLGIGFALQVRDEPVPVRPHVSLRNKGGQPISIQLPEVTLQRVRTTVTMPDGGTMMLDGSTVTLTLRACPGELVDIPRMKSSPWA